MATNFRVPSGVREEALLGRSLHVKHGYGGGERTMQINRLLVSNRRVGLKTAISVYKYYARHAPVDPKGENFDNRKRPSKGYIMWKLMGGDAGQQWARKLRRGTRSEIQKSINRFRRIRQLVNDGMV